METEFVEITYGNAPLLAPDPAGEMVSHLQQHFSWFFEPSNPLTHAPSNLRQACCDNKPPLVLPRWNAEPRLGLYQLYIPCGFTRPMRMYGLVPFDNLFGSAFFTLRAGKWPTKSLFEKRMSVDDAVRVTKDVALVRFVNADWEEKNGQIFYPFEPKPNRITVLDLAKIFLGELYRFDDRTPEIIKSNIDWPDLYADVDSLWRPGELVSVLLEALLGALCANPRLYFKPDNEDLEDYFQIQPHDTIDEDSLGRGPVDVVVSEQRNGRKRCDLLPYSYSARNAVSVSAVNDEFRDVAKVIEQLEDRSFFYGRYARVGTYGGPSPILDNSYLGYDCQIIDLTPSGGGRVSSFIPVQAYPIQRHYYWIGEEKPTCEPEDVIRVQLVEDMPVCGDAAALHLSDLEESANCPCSPVKQVMVVDTAGIARTRIRNGQRFAPVQSMGFAKRLRCGDSGEADVYELVSIGQGCCPEPTSSQYQECCKIWYTRFDDLQTVVNKPLGAVINYGETVGTSKSDGFRYKAFFSSSMQPDGCAIDLSGIHAYTTRNSRASGNLPCSPPATECEIQHALLRMAGKMPFDSSNCQLAWEDLADAGNGNDYFRRKIAASPQNCMTGKKVYNFTSALTTVFAIGADYIVLKHECEEESSSSGGIDSCCVLLTEFDLRCVNGRLQRWKQDTEVCWNGDCLEKRVVSNWRYTGQQAGCCDCGSGASSSSSGGGGGGDPGGGGGVLTTCCPNTPIPQTLNVTITGGSCAGNYTLTWNAAGNHWISGDFVPDGFLELSCEPFGWYLSLNFEGSSPINISCNPFSLTFNFFNDVLCGSGTITITG